MKLKKYLWILLIHCLLICTPRVAPALPLEIVFHLLPRSFELVSAWQHRSSVEPMSVVGRVVDEAGEPLGGAKVFIREPGAKAIQETRTPADGSFVLIPLPAATELELWAEHEDAQTAVILVKPEGVGEIVLVLEAASRIAGRVVSGVEGVAGALVLVRSGERSRASAQCDAEGRFSIRGIRPGLLELRAVSPGLTGEPIHFDLAAGESAEELEIPLSPGLSIEGIVRSAQGEPLPGVVVERVAEDRDLATRLVATRARTDAEGVYRLSGLPYGPVRLRARRADLIASEKTIELAMETTDLDWQLGAGERLRGRIVTAEGRPVVGAAISVFDDQGRGVVDGVLSDGKGSFELEGLPAGVVRVVGEPVAEARTEEVVTLVAGADPPPIVLRCPPAASLAGRLYGASVEVLAKAQLWATGPQGEQRAGELTRDGGYRIPALAPGSWRVAIRVPGWPREVSRETQLKAGEAATLDLDLSLAGFRLWGQVARDGEPLAGLLVAATSIGSVSSGAVTDGQGVFEIEALPAGTYQITLLGAGTHHSRAIELGGDLQLDFDLTLQPSEPFNDTSPEEIR